MDHAEIVLADAVRHLQEQWLELLGRLEWSRDSLTEPTARQMERVSDAICQLVRAHRESTTPGSAAVRRPLRPVVVHHNRKGTNHGRSRQRTGLQVGD